MLGNLWRTQRLALIAFLLALSVTGFFATRFIASSIYWADPAHRNVQIEGWMTPGYIARSYRVPPEVVRAALGLRREDGRQTIAEIAARRATSLEALSVEILAAVNGARLLRSEPPQ